MSLHEEVIMCRACETTQAFTFLHRYVESSAGMWQASANEAILVTTVKITPLTPPPPPFCHSQIVPPIDVPSQAAEVEEGVIDDLCSTL